MSFHMPNPSKAAGPLPVPSDGYPPNTRDANQWISWLLTNVFTGDRSPRARDAVHKSEKMSSPKVPSTPSESQPRKMVVRLIENDTFGAAKEIHSLYPNDKIAVLNMANHKTAGGGFLGGGRAQEEDLCHCSTLYRALTLNPTFYQITDNELIYSPDVLVLKSKTNDPKFPRGKPMHQDDWFFTDVISCPAPRMPATAPTQNKDTDGQVQYYDTYTNAADEQLMRSKLNYILNAALQKGVQRLVLGAFGCGVFRNPRVQVAQIMKEILVGDAHQGPRTDWGRHGLHEVVIAIYDPPNNTNVRENFDAFMSVFRHGSNLHTTVTVENNHVPIPDHIQYTTFPPHYPAAMEDQSTDKV